MPRQSFKSRELIFRRNTNLKYSQLAVIFKYILLLGLKQQQPSELEEEAESSHTQT